MKTQEPIPGTPVHYVDMEPAEDAGKFFHRAAVIVAVQDKETWVVALHVLGRDSNHVYFAADVPYDGSGQRYGSWHFLEG